MDTLISEWTRPHQISCPLSDYLGLPHCFIHILIMADHLSEGTDLSQVDALTVPWGGGGEGKGKEGRGRAGRKGGRAARCRWRVA